MNARKSKPDIAVEIRRLQKVAALLVCIQHSANYDVEFSVADALSIVVSLVEETLAGLDRVELQHAQR